MKVWFFIALAISPAAHARVFSMKELNLGPYIRGTFGPSHVDQEPFVHAAGYEGGGGTGKETVFSSGDTSTYNYGGELGLLVNLGALNLRVGAELLQATPVTGASGKGKGDDIEKYVLNSSTFVFNPTVAIEAIVHTMSASRFLVNFGVGAATVNLENKYVFSSTTVANHFGVDGDYTEKSKGSALNYYLSVGWETHFVDRAMLMFEAGYRIFKVNKLSLTEGVKSIPQHPGGKSASKGDPLLNDDGTGRKFDLSGGFVGLSFRFYLQ